MNFKKLSLAVAGAFALSIGSVAVQAAGGGKVNFEGSVIDAPCSLSAKSVDQTIRLGQVSNKALANNGVSETETFNIELLQCDIATLKKVRVTFGGDIDTTDPTLLAILGKVSGAGIELTKGNQVVKLYEPLSAQTLMAGDNTLTFGVRLKGTAAKDESVTTGKFTATTNFQLAYE